MCRLRKRNQAGSTHAGCGKEEGGQGKCVVSADLLLQVQRVGCRTYTAPMHHSLPGLQACSCYSAACCPHHRMTAASDACSPHSVLVGAPQQAQRIQRHCPGQHGVRIQPLAARLNVGHGDLAGCRAVARSISQVRVQCRLPLWEQRTTQPEAAAAAPKSVSRCIHLQQQRAPLCMAHLVQVGEAVLYRLVAGIVPPPKPAARQGGQKA